MLASWIDGALAGCWVACGIACAMFATAYNRVMECTPPRVRWLIRQSVVCAIAFTLLASYSGLLLHWKAGAP